MQYLLNSLNSLPPKFSAGFVIPKLSIVQNVSPENPKTAWVIAYEKGNEISTF